MSCSRHFDRCPLVCMRARRGQPARRAFIRVRTLSEIKPNKRYTREGSLRSLFKSVVYPPKFENMVKMSDARFFFFNFFLEQRVLRSHRRESGYFCAEPSWSPRAPRARRPPREHPEWPSYGHYGRPAARRRHHGTRTSTHGHPRAVPSPGGAGSRRPWPRIRPPPKNNSKTLRAPRTPELTD
jgi:hypothetical protein